MKKNILKNIFLLFSFITFAQNNVSHCNYNDSIFKLLQNEMTFDIQKYKVETMTGDYTILFDNQNYKSYFFKTTGSIYYKQINKKINVYKVINYYYDGKIESVNLYYTPDIEESGVNIGILKNFDNRGNLSEEYNYDKGYKICYDQVIPIVKKIIGLKKIKKYELKFSIGRSDLNEFPDGKAKWIVGVTGNDKFQKKIKPSNSHDYVIDGVTGKLIGILKPTYALE